MTKRRQRAPYDNEAEQAPAKMVQQVTKMLFDATIGGEVVGTSAQVKKRIASLHWLVDIPAIWPH